LKNLELFSVFFPIFFEVVSSFSLCFAWKHTMHDHLLLLLLLLLVIPLIFRH
jgi:hypothetical protein